MRKTIIVALVFVSFAAVGFQQASAQPPAGMPFEAMFQGVFDPSQDIGRSPLFIVAEKGGGEEASLGEFTYEATLPQNLARAPEECGFFSSTAVNGKQTIVFANGELSLKRTSGSACFTFPTVTVEEQWVVASGTGDFVGATGKLTKHAEGNVITGIATGTMEGVVFMR